MRLGGCEWGWVNVSGFERDWVGVRGTGWM